MEWLYNKGVGTIVISSGEFNNEGRTEFIETIIENTIQKSIEIDRGYRVVLFHYRSRMAIILEVHLSRLVCKWVKFQ